MVKKVCILLLYILTAITVLPTSESYALSRSEKNAKCATLKSAAKEASQDTSLKGSIVPIYVLNNFSNTVHNISNTLVTLQVLGDALMCHAVHGAPWEMKVGNIHLKDWANIPIWLCGAVIYCFGFMLVLSVAFYIVDVSFKLGFAIIVLPVAVALWPFAWTKDKLSVCISIFLKSAGILIFLSLTTAYTLNMLSEALGGLTPIMEALTDNKTREVAETFSLTSSQFLLVVVVLIYGMQLISSTIPDYVDKFFEDKAFGGGEASSPMHSLSTQGIDFVKKKAIAPMASYAHDVVRTQTGRAIAGTGKLLQGKYHDKIKQAAAVNAAESLINKAKAVAKSQAADAAGAIHKQYNNAKFGAKNALGSIALKGQERENFKEQMKKENEAANARVDQKLEEYQQKLKQDAMGGAGSGKEPQQTGNQQNANPQEAKNQTQPVNQEANKSSDGTEQNNQQQKQLESIDKWKKSVNDSVDKALADKESDKLGVKALKMVGRGLTKTAVNLTATSAKLATKTANEVNKAANLVLKQSENGANKQAQKANEIAGAVSKFSMVKKVLKVPGKILENIGNAMQHNTPRSYGNDDKEEGDDDENDE